MTEEQQTTEAADISWRIVTSNKLAEARADFRRLREIATLTDEFLEQIVWLEISERRRRAI